MKLAGSPRRVWLVRGTIVLLVAVIIVPLVGFFFAPKADAVALTIVSSVSESAQTTTSTTFAASDTVIAAGSLPAGTYLVTWGAAIANSSANETMFARLVRGSTEIAMAGSEGNAAGAANNGRAAGGYWLGTLSGSEALTIEYMVSNSGSTGHIDSKFIKAIRLDDKLVEGSDYYTTGPQEPNTNEVGNAVTGSWTTVKSLTETFHGSGSQNYLVLASLEIDVDVAADDCMARLVVDGTALLSSTQEGEDTTNDDVFAYTTADLASLGSGAKTISLQGQSVGSASCDYLRSRIYVFRANIFDQLVENESLGESTSTSITWSDKTTQAYTPNQTEDIMIFANQMQSASVAATAGATRINNTTDAVVYADTMSHTVNNATVPDYFTTMSAASLNVSGAKTFKTQFQRSTGSGTARIKEARLIIWSMTLVDAQMQQGAYRWFENIDALGSDDTWWNGSWGARRRITFNNSASAENLTNFPVRVSLSGANIDYNKTQNSGQDLRFIDGDGAVLKHEIETWNESGTSEVWVKVPQIDAGSTTDYIYMYYDNAVAGDGQDIANVWDSNFKTVLHLDETPANDVAGHDDSTSGNHDATPKSFAGSAGSTTSATGKISGGDHFNTDNDHLEIVDHADYTLSVSGAYTWSAWVNPDSMPSWATIWAHDLDSGNFLHIYNHTRTNTWLPGGAVTSGVSVWWEAPVNVYIVADTTDNALTTGTFQLVTVTYDGSQSAANRFKIYVNGVNVTSGSASVAGTVTGINPSYTWVGGNQAYGEYYDGVLDEMRFHTSLRSADWIEADYLSMNDAMNAFAGEETNVSGLTPLASANTAASVDVDTPFRLRQFLEQTQLTTPINTTFKLQYAEKSGTCDTAFSGESYTDLPTSGSSLAYFNNPSLSNGAQIAGLSNDAAPTGTLAAQHYVEANNFSNSISSLPSGHAGLWDFAITAGASAAGKTFCFRTVYSGGSTLYSYAHIAEISVNSGGPTVPTTEQQLRHGQGVIDGEETPLAL